jgi:DNA repair photolyase
MLMAGISGGRGKTSRKVAKRLKKQNKRVKFEQKKEEKRKSKINEKTKKQKRGKKGKRGGLIGERVEYRKCLVTGGWVAKPARKELVCIPARRRFGWFPISRSGQASTEHQQ